MRLLLITAILFNFQGVVAQFKSEDVLRKELSFEKSDPTNVLQIANINGEIQVKKTIRSTIRISAKRILNAKTSDRLEEAKQINLGVKDLYDTLIVYVTGVCGTFTQSGKGWGKGYKGWNYNWDECDDRFKFRLDFTIEVPQGQKLVLSTINNGDILVDDISGDLHLRNVNGSIKVEQAKGELNARTINGDVNIDFRDLPSRPMDLYTLNGDITIQYSGTLNAEVSFKSFNGDLYTNEENYNQMPMKMVKRPSDKTKGISQKLESRSVIQLGKGGLSIELETFNGDAYLKNSQNN